MQGLNWLAIVVAALSSFLVGGLWYSPLMFHAAWLRETGLTDERLKQSNMGLIFGLSFLFALVATVVFAFFLGPRPTFAFATGAGVAAGVGWIATSFGINYLFERKSLTLFAINAGYHVVQFTLMGVILGAWS